jgi:DNA-binding SARP family transcriptional activator/Tfp pilus assembly protein PilF
MRGTAGSALRAATGATVQGGRMWFGILGPLLVRDGETVVPVMGARQRLLLAALIMQAGKPVAADTLAEMVWDGTPPAGAVTTLRSHVMRLRRVLGPVAGARLVTRPPGYLLEAVEDEVDLLLFAALCQAGGAAVRRAAWPEASGLLEQALGLWRGAPLADVPSEMLHRAEAPRLERLRLQALEWRAEAGLRLGRHSELVAELQALTAEHPLRERFLAQLLLALYRCGRRAEALAAYQGARQVLIDELGSEPGAELVGLHQQILTADPALDVPPQPAAAVGHVVPRELPAGVRHFTGRAREFAALTELLDQPGGQRPGMVVIGAIGGTAGVGKTALAVSWAHQIAGRFPDGQLHVNLRGYDKNQPVSAADALAGLLQALGVPGQDIPDEMEDRARLYRTRLAGRRMLVLLDNARDGDQVRPLLPGDPGCVAVVTSRDALAGLVAADGARRLDLDVLPLADAVGLLRSLIGSRAVADPGAVTALAGLCARLPLALRIAAELAAARPAVPLAELAAELAASRLDLLDAGEARTDVRAVFSWSYRQLPDDAAGAFALIGLHPGEDLDAHAAAALTGTSAGQAGLMLGRLHRASLLQASGTGRYGMHDLLRAYAREQAAARDTGGSCHQALTRLFDYYLAAAAAAMEVLYPAEAHRRPRIPALAAAMPAMPSEADARAWLDAERANLVAVAVHCAGHGWPDHATGLAGTLFRYLISGSHLPEAHTIYGHALQAARRSGDMAAEASALNGLGGLAMMKGRFRDAACHYQAALEAYRQCGDLARQAAVLQNLGATEHELHDFRSAAGHCREAIAAYDDAGDSLGAAGALVTLATAETELGSYDQASRHFRRALPVLRDAQDEVGEAEALEGIGELSLCRGQLAQAAACYEQALAIYRRIDNPAGVADQLRRLGDVSLRRAEYQKAVSYLRQALALSVEAGHQHGEITARRILAEALHRAGQPAAARDELAAALRLAAGTGDVYQQASVHRELAESHQRTGEDEQARHHWQQALALYTKLGAPEADQVQSRLSTQHTNPGSPSFAC